MCHFGLGADVYVLRRDVLAKASLIVLHRRAVARCGVVFGINLTCSSQTASSAWRVSSRFSVATCFFRPRCRWKAAFRPTPAGHQQLIMGHAALLQTPANQRQDRRDVLHSFARLVVRNDA